MIEKSLEQANAADLQELRQLLSQQEHQERLHPIRMKAINISHGALSGVCDAVRSLSTGKRVLVVTGPTLIVDTREEDIKKKAVALLSSAFQTEHLVLSELPQVLHATPENAAIIQSKLQDVDCVVGIGGGTICDLCKYATYYAAPETPLPLVIVQTALSVNAFSDDSSVMLIHGVKRTVHSRYPAVLIIDLDIVGAAPPEMNVSGYGDLIATWTAPADWYLGNVLGMGKNFHTAPSDMIRSQCEELLRNSSRLADGESKVLGDLANVLTLSGLSMGLADESSPASGSEHVMSHLVDMASGVRKTGICYHGTQVAVSGIISSILWDYLLHEFDPKAVDIDKCYPSPEEMEPRVRAAFDWLGETHSASDECWSDYRKKLAKWHENKEAFQAFLRDFDQFKARVLPWVKKPEYISMCMHNANAPCRYSQLNYPVDAKTALWAISNCHLMRSRFSIVDLLYYTGIWNERFVEKVVARAKAMDAGL